jgi:ABC-2 type transport system permease protein
MVVHGDKLRWLFWLRLRILTRGFRRSRASLIGSIVFLLFVLVGAGWAAFGTFAAYRYLPSPANYEVLYLVLSGLLLLWIVLPLMEFASNEGLDLSKLQLFPLTRAEMMISLLFSTLLDIPTIGLLLLLGAVVVGWGVSLPVVLLSLAAMLVFYVQLVAISQLVLALFMRTLQSRRFRDFSIIIIAVFTASCYLAQQLALGGSRILQLYANLQAGSYSPFLQWLPSGYAATAIKQAIVGNWGLSLGALGLLLVLSIVFLYLWQLVLERSLSASETGGSARMSNRRKQQAAPGVGTRFSAPSPTSVSARASTSTGLPDRLISSQVRAIASKEMKYFWRDPQLKAMLFQSVIYLGIFIIGPLLNPDAGGFGAGSNYILYVATPVALLYLATISLNTLGLERESLTTTFLFPVPPQRLLWGKNLVVFLFGLLELTILIGFGAYFSKDWMLVVPVAVLGLAGMGITLGCGNFTSVYFPQYVRQMQRGFRATGTTSQSGCLRGLMSLVMLLVTAVLVAPVGAAVFLPYAFNARWIWSITIPASLIYGIAFHQIVTRAVAPRIVEMAPEILAVTTRQQ